MICCPFSWLPSPFHCNLSRDRCEVRGPTLASSTPDVDRSIFIPTPPIAITTTSNTVTPSSAIMDYRLPTLQHHHSDSNVSHASSYQLAHDEIDPDLLSLRSGAGGADHLSSEDGNAASGLVQIGNSLSGRSESIGPGGTNADGTPVIRRLA